MSVIYNELSIFLSFVFFLWCMIIAARNTTTKEKLSSDRFQMMISIEIGDWKEESELPPPPFLNDSKLHAERALPSPSLSSPPPSSLRGGCKVLDEVFANFSVFLLFHPHFRLWKRGPERERGSKKERE